MTRGEVAGRAGVNRSTVRYYEDRELIPAPPRTSAGYRQYTEEYVQRIRFVKRAQEIGFTLAETKELLETRADPDAGAEEVREQTQAKIEEVEGKIRDLRRIREALSRLLTSCDERRPAAGDCPIIGALRSEDAFREAASTQSD